MRYTGDIQTTKGVPAVNVSRAALAPAAIVAALCFAACAGTTNTPASSTGQISPGAATQSESAQSSPGYMGHHGGFLHALRGIDLTDQQRAQIARSMQQYRSAHPGGSAFDPQARQQLHQQLLSVLTPQQQAQFKRNLAQMHGAGWMSGLNLSEQQRTQIKQAMQQFRQAHPQGSNVDPAAREQLHDKVLAILTPQQQAQWKQRRMQLWRGRGPMHGISLSEQQKSKIEALVQQFRQNHPPTIAFDPQARKQLRQQIFNVLTPPQQAQYQRNLQQMHPHFSQPNASGMSHR
jgi:Spy/CpxP family protein refolding chaperone